MKRKPHRQGTLKEDFFTIDLIRLRSDDLVEAFGHYSVNLQDLVGFIEKKLTAAIKENGKKGDKFVSYLRGRQEEWYDKDGEFVDTEWAEKNLEIQGCVSG